MDDSCRICGRNSREANFLTAILDNEPELVRICETCAVIEKAVIVPMPGKMQIKNSEVPYTVYERLSRMSGLSPKQDYLLREHAKQEKAKQTARRVLNQQTSSASVLKLGKSMRKNPEREDTSIKLKGNGEAVINFSSQDIKIGDLQKLRRKMPEKQ
ncbi:MAG: hypothetical protein V1886_00445 [archaeon]